MLFKYIFINRIQPFEAANISAAFFLCRPMRMHNCCHTFQNKFQDDISCTLAMYSYIQDSLYEKKKKKNCACKYIKGCLQKMKVGVLQNKVGYLISYNSTHIYFFLGGGHKVNFPFPVFRVQNCLQLQMLQLVVLQQQINHILIRPPQWPVASPSPLNSSLNH